MRRIILSSTHPVKSLHGNTQAEWELMSQEEQLRAWLKTCPFDYTLVEGSKKKGQIAYVFELVEEYEQKKDIDDG